MWIKVKSGLVNLDKIAKVEIAEWDDEDGTVVRVEAIEAGGDASSASTTGGIGRRPKPCSPRLSGR